MSLVVDSLGLPDDVDVVVDVDSLDIFDLGSSSDIICLLVPDTQMSNVYNSYIENNLRPGQTLLFSHGYAIHYNVINPPDYIDVVMVAPKGPGHTVRWEYQNGQGVPAICIASKTLSS